MLVQKALTCTNILRLSKSLPTQIARLSSLARHSRVGFIGLGNMGLPMACNLAKEYVVVGSDTNETAKEVAVEKGIVIAESLQEFKDCGIIFSMLPGCNAVDAVMSELYDVLPESPTRILVDCSTVSPAISRKWHKEWIKKGHIMLDAPVSGGVKGASDGSLTFMVGTEHEEGVKAIKPYLHLMGSRILECGPIGSGAATKLCNNLALAIQMIGIAEAMSLGDALGVDPVTLADVLNVSKAKCWSCEVNNPHPEVGIARSSHSTGPPSSQDYKGGFAAKLMLKDLGLAMDAASTSNIAMPMTSLSKELYKLVTLHGHGDKDFGVVFQILRGPK